MMSDTTGGNPLMGDTPQLDPTPQAHPLAEHLGALAQAHTAALAQFNATSKAQAQFTTLRKVFDGLVAKADTVTPEDVIGEAGKLAAHGFDPRQLAGILADMPEAGGQALAGWLAQREQGLSQAEAQIAQAHTIAQHKLGVASLHALIGHGMVAEHMAQTPVNALGSVH